MNVRPKEGTVRLIVGFTLNAVLWFVFRKLALFSNVEGEFLTALIGGCLAGSVLVFVLPIFWRGRPWQAPIAFVLLWLPVIVLWQVFQVVLQYR